MNARFQLRDPSEPAPSADQRRARNLDYCEYLIDRGMTLARAASDRALDEIATTPAVTRIPTSMAAEIDKWKEEARRRGPNHGKLFTLISRCIRQTMLLEMYLAEGHTPNPAPRTQATQRQAAADPAPPPRPEPEPLRRDYVERLDCMLEDPVLDDEAQVQRILQSIGRDLGLGPRVPDAPAIAKPPNTRTASCPSSPRPPNQAPEAQTASAGPPETTPRQNTRRW